MPTVNVSYKTMAKLIRLSKEHGATIKDVVDALVLETEIVGISKPDKRSKSGFVKKLPTYVKELIEELE